MFQAILTTSQKTDLFQNSGHLFPQIVPPMCQDSILGLKSRTVGILSVFFTLIQVLLYLGAFTLGDQG